MKRYSTWRVTESKNQETTQDLRDAHNASNEDNQGMKEHRRKLERKKEIMI